MNTNRSKIPIVVLTPVRNEEWIMDRFLAVTSQFADHIIVADQDSWDQTPQICKKYEKVILIRNDAPAFNEAERQTLLINAARDLVPGEKILLALDADEILAADAIQSSAWEKMLAAPAGTVLYFQKIDLTPSIDRFFDWGTVPSPLGYVDDGAAHHPEQIHSTRIPAPRSANQLYLHGVNILHYGFTRRRNQSARRRFYSVVENTLNLTTVWIRRHRYSSYEDFDQYPVKDCSTSWFQDWENQRIDMRTIADSEFYWQDFEVLRYFQRYGTRRYWLDDLWNFDWEACRTVAHDLGLADIPEQPIAMAHPSISFAMTKLAPLYRLYKQIKS